MIEAPVNARIRPAGVADAPALSALLRSLNLFARMENEPEATTRQTVARHLESCIGSPSHSVYLATDDDDLLLGYAAVHWLPYLILPGPEGFVSELFVADSARGKGIGTALLREVEREASERGCSRMHLINFRDRESYERRFYEKAGWQERPDSASFVRRIDMQAT